MANTASALPESTAPGIAPVPGMAAHAPTATFSALFIGSIGVVYGDIGTSPLYAFREALAAAGATTTGVDRNVVLGVLSLILWALVLIVTVKYVIVLLRADNNGEGGTLSLMALAQRALAGTGSSRSATWIAVLGMTGAALFYGDAVITPAISVLSAVEGLKLVTPAFEPYVLPITIVILIVLFAVQAKGTAAVAAWFGPITAVWFVAIGAAGALHIFDDPAVFLAINPYYAVAFLANHGLIGLATLGAVFLAVTGAEALYADLGHFGRKPIQSAWIVLVLPCLALNYFGQGALVLSDPAAVANPFFLLVPEWGLLPMVLLATAATVIASQAVITGAFSLTRQAVQLGLLPRMRVTHTSSAHAGQIYVPRINGLLLIGVLVLVLAFQSSSALAHAYGIAVTGTMLVTAIMAFIVIRRVWGWSLLATAALIVPFIVIELLFLGANLMKVLSGGWVPLVLAAVLVVLMLTWRMGSRMLADKNRKSEVPLDTLIKSLMKSPPTIVKGTAIFLTSDPTSAPTAMLHSLKHYKVLHEKNAILTITTADTPRVPPEDRLSVERLEGPFWRIRLCFGYMEEPNVPRAMQMLRKSGWPFDIMTTSFFLSRRSMKAAEKSDMPHWQDALFISLARNADDASDYFHIPTGRVVEIGTQIAI